MKNFLSLVLVFTIIFAFSFSYSTSLPASEEISGTDVVKENLEELTNEEKKVLEELFILVQDIYEMEAVERTTSVEIDDLKADIENMEDLIKEKEFQYDDSLNIMEEVLKNHQKNGSTSYIEMILSSDSLQILLRRINLIREISRNTESLLEELELSKKELIEDKETLQSSLEQVEERQRQLQEAIKSQTILKNNLELRLASLKEDKAKFEEYLNKLENSWAEIKPIFTETINMLTKMIEEGNIPSDTIDISFSLTGVRGIIKEESLDDILLSQKFPTRVEIKLQKDKLQLIMPDIKIFMSGSLEILEGRQSLRFNMEEGSFMDMKLESSAMEELFSFGYLEFNFKKLLDKSTIRAVNINEDNLELLINPVLF